MSLHSLPIFVRLAGRPVMLIGDGEAADAKRRLLERAGAEIVGEDAQATLAIIALEDTGAAEAVAARLKARGALVNVVDRPALCDFTIPAIIDRDPVLVAIGTGGASAGLAAALRQRLEAILPSGLGPLATALAAARAAMRARWPDGGDRRRALADGLAAGGAIDPLGPDPDVTGWLANATDAGRTDLHVIHAVSSDPDDLTLRDARMLAQADRVYHARNAAAALLDRARADAERIVADGPPVDLLPGVSVYLEMAR